MATWEDVRRLASELPGAEEGTSYRRPATRKWRSSSGSDPLEKPLLIESRPDLYFTTPHYDRWPMLLVRLDDADDDALRRTRG